MGFIPPILWLLLAVSLDLSDKAFCAGLISVGVAFILGVVEGSR